MTRPIIRRRSLLGRLRRLPALWWLQVRLFRQRGVGRWESAVLATRLAWTVVKP